MESPSIPRPVQTLRRCRGPMVTECGTSHPMEHIGGATVVPLSVCLKSQRATVVEAAQQMSSSGVRVAA